MGYDRHAGHAEIFGSGPGKRGAKSSYDGKRKEGSRGNALRAYNPIQSGKFGQGNLPTPDLAGRLAIGGKSPGCQYAGRSAKELASPNNEKALAQRDARLRKSDKRTWHNDHPQHPNWRRAVMKAPSRKLAGI